jgi:hypothetical protein
MSSRAERDMSMAAHATPSMVGPGAYVSTGGFCSKPAKPSYAGFSSSLARGGRGGAGGGGYGGAGNNGGPGPGAYDASSGLEKEPASWAGGNVKGSHGMASSAPRIAPIYPGSTPFSASECIYTPGPGTYAAKGSMDGVCICATHSPTHSLSLFLSFLVTYLLCQLVRPSQPASESLSVAHPIRPRRRREGDPVARTFCSFVASILRSSIHVPPGWPA